MPKTTKVVNQTGRSILVKEGTEGVYHMLCRNLRNGKPHIIEVDRNALDSEYWFSVTPEDENRLVIFADDFMEYREVHIRLRADDTYTWDAVRRRSHELVRDVGDRGASSSRPAQASSPPLAQASSSLPAQASSPPLAQASSPLPSQASSSLPSQASSSLPSQASSPLPSQASSPVLSQASSLGPGLGVGKARNKFRFWRSR